MHYWSQWLASDVCQIQPGVDGIIYQSNNSNVVATDYVKTEHNLLNARRCGENALMAFVDDDIYGLVEAFKCSYKVAPVRRDNGDCVVNVRLQARHCVSS